MATTEMWTYRGDIRSGVDLSGYEVEARDGSIGTVDEATNEVGSSYLVVDTGPWIFGKHVVLPAGVVETVDTNNRRIVVSRTRDEIKNAPEYDPQDAITMVYRQTVGSYYSAPSTGQPRRASSSSRSSQKRRTTTRSRAKSSGSRRRTRSSSRPRQQSEGPTREELYEEAKRLDVEGRSTMNKTELARAVGRKRGAAKRRSTSQRGRSASTGSRSRAQSSRQRAGTQANPVEVQAFLSGVSYPTRKGDLLREAERSGAKREVQTTLERLPEKRFGSPTEVSQAIGKLR